jgi:hypothetical protein
VQNRSNENEPKNLGAGTLEISTLRLNCSSGESVNLNQLPCRERFIKCQFSHLGINNFSARRAKRCSDYVPLAHFARQSLERWLPNCRVCMTERERGGWLITILVRWTTGAEFVSFRRVTLSVWNREKSFFAYDVLICVPLTFCLFSCIAVSDEECPESRARMD